MLSFSRIVWVTGLVFRVLNERMARTGKREDEVDMSDVLAALQQKSRDNGRTPVQVRSDCISCVINVN